MIAAILTLIGYSMNDTIVVFDRIRENLRLSRRETLPDVVNRSINQTLSRTVLTSGLTFLTVLSLLLFRRAGAARLFVCAGGGHSDRNVFVDCGRGSDAGGVAGVAQGEGQGGRASGEAGQSLKQLASCWAIPRLSCSGDVCSCGLIPEDFRVAGIAARDFSYKICCAAGTGREKLPTINALKVLTAAADGWEQFRAARCLSGVTNSFRGWPCLKIPHLNPAARSRRKSGRWMMVTGSDQRRHSRRADHYSADLP